MRRGFSLPVACAMGALLACAARAPGAEIHVGPGRGTSMGVALSRARPGDVVLVHGGVYEPVRISCSGRENAPVIIKAAPGTRPVFDGSAVGFAERGPVWKKVKGEVYGAPCEGSPLTAIVDDTIVPKAGSLETMTEGSYFAGNGNVYVWCPGGGDPAAHETGVLVSKWGGVSIRGDWVVLDGFLSRFSSGTGIAVFGKHCEVRNCEAKWSAGNGIRFFKPCSHSRAVDNVVHDNFCAQFPRGTRNGGWGYGLGTGSRVPDCEFIGNTVYGNNGEGLGCYNQSHRTVMRNNVVHDNWSVNIYIDSCADCLVDGNLIFNTGVCRLPEHRRSNPPGIMCADERYEGGPYLERLTVINNIVTHCRNGFSFAKWQGCQEGSALKDSLVANNTFVDNESGISIAPTQRSVFANNIVLQTNGKQFIWTRKRDAGETDVKWRNNIFFGTNRHGFVWHGKSLSFGQWQKTCTGAEGNVWSDPLLAAATGVEPDAYRPKRGSICIDSGVAIEQVSHDFSGAARPQGKQVDVGAFEYVVNRPKPAASRRRTSPKATRPDPLRQARLAALTSDFDGAIARAGDADGADRASVAAFIAGCEAGRKLKAIVIDNAPTVKPTVALRFGGTLVQARILAADAGAVTVDMGGSRGPLPWHQLKPLEFYTVAAALTDEHSLLAAYCEAVGLPKQARKERAAALRRNRAAGRTR